MHAGYRCPLCQSPRGEQIYSQVGIALTSLQESKDIEVSKTDYSVCQDCGLISQYPLPTLAELERYYSSTPATSMDAQLGGKAEIYQDRTRFLSELTGLREGRALEVGASYGSFLHLLREKTGLEVVGIEASDACCAQAKLKYDIPLLNTLFETLDLEEEGFIGAFDLVVAMHTLEHTIHPAIFLEKLVQLLKPGGYLYIEVPSIERAYQLNRSMCGAIIHNLHICHFPGLTLSRALDTLGISVMEQRNTIAFDNPCLQVLGQKAPLTELGKQNFLRKVAHLERTFVEAAEGIRALLEKYSQVTLWGAGVDLYQVLALAPDIAQSDRIALADNSLQKQGKRLRGLTIKNPSDITDIECLVITPLHRNLRLDIGADLEKRYPGVPCYDLFPSIDEPQVDSSRPVMTFG